MTNEEKYEKIKFFADKKDVVGMLGVFQIDDTNQKLEFVKFLKKIDPKLFYNVHPIIMEELEKQHKVMDSCVFVLENSKISQLTKSKLSAYCKEVVEECIVIATSARDLCEIFDMVQQQ